MQLPYCMGPPFLRYSHVGPMGDTATHDAPPPTTTPLFSVPLSRAPTSKIHLNVYF